MSTVTPADPGPAHPTGSGEGGVQSVHRVLDVLESVAAAGGRLSLNEIAARSVLPVPTAHRLLGTLVARGYMRRTPDRAYALGLRLLPLAAAAGSVVPVGAEAVLARLVDSLGETANLAVLTGARAEYVAQVPSRHRMRMFTEVGRQVDLHCTGVGKALLGRLDDDRVREVVRRAGMARQTEHTLVEETALLADLAAVRSRGYALDEEEQELGVRCVAMTVGDGPLTLMAVSVSGPLTRMTDDLVARAVPLLRAAGDDLAARLLA